MARPAQDPQIRITEILNAAEPLFYEKGYHETAISDIAHSMNVAQGTLYYYFKSKEEIFEALINRHLSALISEFQVIVSSDAITPLHKMETIIKAMFLGINYKGKLLFEFVYNDQNMHLIDKICRQGKKLLAPLILKVIKEGKEQKYFRITDPQVTLTFFLGVMECLIDVVYTKPSKESLRSHLKVAEALLEKILNNKPGTIRIIIEKEIVR